MDKRKEIIIEVLVSLLNTMLKSKINAFNLCQQKTDTGGVFVSTMKEGLVISSYFHPTKRHSATADGGIGGGGCVKSIANPGEWAVAKSQAGICLRKTYYNNLE